MSDVSNAINEFLEKGGKVVKAHHVIPVTGPEVVDYLLSCGFRAKYFPGDLRAYKCEGKRYSLTKLVKWTNSHRAARQLPPFAIRVTISLNAGGRPD